MSGPEQDSKKSGSRERRQTYVVLPVYNEEARIGNLLHRLDEAMGDADIPFQVILVDDGSRDATGQIVQAHTSRMPIRHPRGVSLHDLTGGVPATIVDEDHLKWDVGVPHRLVKAMEQVPDSCLLVVYRQDDVSLPPFA